MTMEPTREQLAQWLEHWESFDRDEVKAIALRAYAAGADAQLEEFGRAFESLPDD
jgi:hypothetical protein